MSQLNNPYWQEVKDLLVDASRSYIAMITQRLPFCQRYSWAVPDPETLQFVGPWLAPKAIEVGAGTGYWAWLLTQQGVEIAAYDTTPPHLFTTNEYHSPRDPLTGSFLHQLVETYVSVASGGPEVLALPRYYGHTLFLCWPPNHNDMAIECLDCYSGDRLVYIGYPRGGCCATDAFFDRLDRDWRVVARHIPARWQSTSDEVVVYERAS